MDERTKKLLRVAGILAQLFSKETDVVAVGLTGSLARHEPNPGDVDLIALHKYGFSDVFTAHLLHEHAPEKEPRYPNSGSLSQTFSKSLSKSVENLCELTETPADIIVVPESVLHSCDWLADVTRHEDSTDFYKRIFCELPSLRYDPKEYVFKSPGLKHKDGKCCFPKVTWTELKEQYVPPS